MKIGFDAKRAFHNHRGLGNYSRTLLKNLYHYYENEEYFLYTPPYEYNLLKGVLGTIVVPEGIRGKVPSLWRTFGLKNQLLKDEIEIFHGLSNELPYKVSKKIKTCVTIHDLIFLRYPELYKKMDRRVYKKKFLYSANNSDKIIAVSQQTKQDIIEFFKIEPEKIDVIYQSCDERFFSDSSIEKKQSIVKKYNLPNDYILFVGALEERKNSLNILKALNNLKNELDIPLVLVGNPSKYQNQIIEYAQKKGLMSRLFILNNVIHNDLPTIYQMANLFIYPSIFEGFGIPIIESLFSKTPVITSTGSCFKEAGGDFSLYLTPNNIDELSYNIVKVLGSEQLQSTMIKHGFEHAQQFLNKPTADKLYNFYQNLYKS